MAAYPFSQIEEKWQKYWEAHNTFAVTEDEKIPKEKRAYILDMFPYPSAQGLHVGHPEGYTATDIYCRFLRMNGYNVLHPMGFDSFGLPAENYAIKTGTHPALTTNANIEQFTRQIKSLGFSYDWTRCVSTCDSDYYRWTQWIFLQLFKRGLAYEAETPINFCPSCKTGLANEEVKDGRCDRCGTAVTKKIIRQWMLRITDYAERLLEDLDGLDWSDSVKAMQRNWIGKSFGAEVDFSIAEDSTGKNKISPNGEKLTVFTTRCDTLFGATYMVIAPEHPLVGALTTAAQKAQVAQYIADAANKSDLERTDLAKEKTGVFSGSYAINPMTQKPIPIWISDYVLVSYGTGAIMAVPAHDERDWDFAKAFDLPVVKVVAQTEIKGEAPDLPVTECTSAYGYSVNSGEFSGLETEKAKEAVMRYIEEKGFGRRTVNYKLRDWIFSRQRYWGEPIPLVHCTQCGTVALDETELPLKLPEVSAYEPTGTGESPLANISGWVNTKCPKCGKEAKRETNTMPQWAGSCWYYLRYLDAHNSGAFASKEKIDYWMPVDLYVGGTEHAVLHLLYARFWHKVLFDIGLVNTKEPFQRLVNQGMITSFAFQRKSKQLVASDAVTEKDGAFFDNETGEKLERVIAKMSKSLKNVINPDDMIREYGADSVRMYEMFMGPLEISKPWNTQGLIGIHRFLEKVWGVAEKIAEKQEDVAHNAGASLSLDSLNALYHKTVKKVTDDTRTLNFNTAISQMMIFVNELVKTASPPSAIWSGFIKLLSPYAPHLAEELWEKFSETAATIAYESWPHYDEALCKESSVTIIVQVNGKIRGKFDAASGTDKTVLENTALQNDGAKKFMEGKPPKKIIVVADKLVNIVV